MIKKDIASRKITICGAGTLGGNLAENLARTGFENLQIIDFDNVEKRNLANQPYFSSDIGQPKVKALSQSLYRAVGSKISTINQRLTIGNGEKFLKDSFIVIDSFDNSDSRKAAKEICEKNKIACLHIGLSPDGYGEAIWNERYTVPSDSSDSKDDPCRQASSRSLSLLVCAAATDAIATYLENGKKKNFTLTIKDLCITQI